MLDYFPYLGMLSWLFWPALIIGIVVYLVRRKKGGKGMGLEEWKRFGMMTAIGTLSAFFIGFTVSSFYPQLRANGPFVAMLILSLAFIIAGVAIMRRVVISYGLILGGILALIYNLGLNLNSLGPATKVVVVGVGLAVLIFIAFKKLKEEVS